MCIRDRARRARPQRCARGRTGAERRRYGGVAEDPACAWRAAWRRTAVQRGTGEADVDPGDADADHRTARKPETRAADAAGLCARLAGAGLSRPPHHPAQRRRVRFDHARRDDSGQECRLRDHDEQRGPRDDLSLIHI